MGMSGLPDIYAQSRPEGRRAEGVHVKETMNAHSITVMCHYKIFLDQK